MAGSQQDSVDNPSIADPVLNARLDAIRSLAGGLTDRVAVMDRHFNVMYANDAAWSTASADEQPDAKCYQAFAHRRQACETCPALKVIETPDASMVCFPEEDDTPCGMRRAFPLASSLGETTSMLVLFKHNESQSRISRQPSVSNTRHDTLCGLVGHSPAMRELFDMIRLVADSSATVLIQGESGTGKELVARTIHELSERKSRPFVVVDCGSLPETLLESELFGHVRGAFTGAISDKRGLFQTAEDGTIFLDEIGDTTPTFQAKLLRVLQESEIRPVGSTERIRIHARVVSATNKDLAELVGAKAFRQDLYYRLAVLPLFLPSLRDRREDIPLLVKRFLAASCERHHQPMRTVSSQVLQTLSEAAWPGNVRELQHYIERAVVTTAGPALICSDLAAKPSWPKTEDLRSAARQAERLRIGEALSAMSGNRVKAAKLLKISRSSLYNKLREHGLT
ncbi:Sensory sigma-54 dependent transcriptional regulator [Nitrospira japonica]|uniref:Sensory sigma-54 dependent transcriptional regulator n=1 Tax=Nitrospira japonica TaxID=1325564 RepID=A0A1W1I2P8_9BACT|nr:sigma-54 dependent transcriptional regulator [Nitrospira japonica]SLM47286.1 Sensory sigma-54 dependent transcriptional regulator [Nitrospira japonica]